MIQHIVPKLYKTQARKNLLVLGLFIVLTAIFTYPKLFCISTCVKDSGDPLLNAWILAWDVRTLLSNPLSVFDTNMFYPHQNTLAYSESQFSNALLALPIYVTTKNPILAHNFVYLFSFVMSGFGMYLLVNHLTKNIAAGVMAGIIFAFVPYRFSHFQIQMLATQWMPLALLYLDRAVHRQKWSSFLLFGLFYNLTILASYYYAMFFTVALIVLGLAYLLIFKRHILTKNFLMPFFFIVFITVIINVPLAKPYFELADLGLVRSKETTELFKITFSDLLITAPENLLYGKLGETLRNSYWSEHVAFPGFIALGLAVFAIVSAVQPRTVWFVKSKPETRKMVFAYTAVLLISFLLAMGASYDVPFTNLTIPLPFGWLFDHVPGFKGLRTPSRFIIITLMMLAILSGYGFAQLQPHIHKQKHVYAASILLTIFIAIEYLSIPIPFYAQAPSEIPEIYTWLQKIDTDEAIIELPFPATVDGNPDFGRLAGIEGWRLYYATYHWMPMVNGYSGFLPYGQDQIIADMLDFPDAKSIRRLNELGVRYVIVHQDQFDEHQKQQFEEYIDQYTDDLHQVAAYGDDLALELQFQGGDEARRALRDVSFGNKIKLIGFGLDTTVYAPGDELSLSLLWRTLEEMSEDYTVFVHLIDEDGNLLAQHDSQPQESPTSAWHRQEIIRSQHTLHIPTDAASGEARLVIGLYAWPSLDRLPVIDSNQRAIDDIITLTDTSIDIP